MLKLELQTPGGAPLAPQDFGDVLPGTSTPPTPFRLVNTGDAPTAALTAWVEQASTEDGEFRVSMAGVLVTGTSPATATALPNLAPGEHLDGEGSWYLAAGARGVPYDTGTLRVRAE